MYLFDLPKIVESQLEVSIADTIDYEKLKGSMTSTRTTSLSDLRREKQIKLYCRRVELAISQHTLASVYKFSWRHALDNQWRSDVVVSQSTNEGSSFHDFMQALNRFISTEKRGVFGLIIASSNSSKTHLTLTSRDGYLHWKTAGKSNMVFQDQVLCGIMNEAFESTAKD